MMGVYKITNLTNQKCYIGSSKNIEERWKNHQYKAFNDNPNNKEYEYPLYRAFRKYGIENFLFEVLKEDFDTVEEMLLYENEMIIHYNSYYKGYNQNFYTMNNKRVSKNPRKQGKKIIGINVNNPDEKIIFSSIVEASKEMNIPRSSITNCILGNKRYSIVHNYIWRELDENDNIIENEISVNDKIAEYNETNPLINGERHNIREWCKIFDISPASFYKRKNKQGMTTIEALTTPKKNWGQ